jgi:hypothetical protein
MRPPHRPGIENQTVRCQRTVARTKLIAWPAKPIDDKRLNAHELQPSAQHLARLAPSDEDYIRLAFVVNPGGIGRQALPPETAVGCDPQRAMFTNAFLKAF